MFIQFHSAVELFGGNIQFFQTQTVFRPRLIKLCVKFRDGQLVGEVQLFQFREAGKILVGDFKGGLLLLKIPLSANFGDLFENIGL